MVKTLVNACTLQCFGPRGAEKESPIAGVLLRVYDDSSVYVSCTRCIYDTDRKRQECNLETDDEAHACTYSSKGR